MCSRSTAALLRSNSACTASDSYGPKCCCPERLNRLATKKANSTHRMRAEMHWFVRPGSFPANGKQLSALEDFLPTPRDRHRTPSDIGSCTADRSCGGIASLMIRSCGNSRLPPPSRRCIFHRRAVGRRLRTRSIFPGCRRWPASTPPFTPTCRSWHGSFLLPRNCNWRASNATAFTAFRANRSCISLQTKCRVA